jgi:hypothetical protein
MARLISWSALLLGTAALSAGSASAQLGPTTKYTTFKAVPGKAVEVGNYAAASQNCTPAPGPAIHVAEPPKLGTLTVRVAELTYNNVFNCPPIRMPAQVVTYEARDGSAAERDHFVYEVTGGKGEVTSHDVTIDVAAPRPRRQRRDASRSSNDRNRCLAR